MIQKIRTDVATAQTLVEVTPDDLMIIARRMHLEAAKAQPGEQIVIQVTERITFKYNPEITTAVAAGRHGSKSLPGTTVSSMMDHKLSAYISDDERSVPKSH